MVLQGVCAGLAFHLEVPSPASCWSWPLCGPKASCYDVKSAPLAPFLPPSPTSGLFYSFTVLSAAPGISRSSPLSHLSTSHGPVVAPRNLCWKSCNSSVSPGCIKSSPLTQPAHDLQPWLGRCCLPRGKDKTFQGKA